jgi:hypothetical protein
MSSDFCLRGYQRAWRGSLFGSICYWLEIRLGLFLGYCLVTLIWDKVLKSRLNGYENDFVDCVKWLEILDLALLAVISFGTISMLMWISLLLSWIG